MLLHTLVCILNAVFKNKFPRKWDGSAAINWEHGWVGILSRDRDVNKHTLWTTPRPWERSEP